MAKRANYEHYFKDVPLDTSFPDNVKCHLITSLDELRKVFSESHDYIAWDTETSDLDPTKGFIVGYSFAFSGDEAYYVPVKHALGISLGQESLKLFHDYLKTVKRCFVYNMRFDYRFMEYSGFNMEGIRYFDVAVGMFLADTNVPMPSLKKSVLKFLGRKAPTFEETLGDNYNFHYLDPNDAYAYACYDALNTYALAAVSIKFYRESKLAGQLDNEFLFPLMRFENRPIKLDTQWLEKLDIDQTERLHNLEKEIYSYAGYQFKIGSGKQLSEVFQSLGLDTGKYVKAGYMKTDIACVEELERKTGHPICKALVEYKKLMKLNNSYTKALLKQAKENNGEGRFCYHTNRVPTDRLCCGKDGKNTFFSPINEQSIPKPHPKMWYVHEYHEGDELKEYDEVVLGYRFSLEDKSDYWIEGADPHDNMRRTFLPGEGNYFVSIDFAAQELRATANLAHEPLWIKTFLEGGDLHKNMAIAMWGADNYDKEKRKKAKTINFGALYGMNEYTLAERFNISIEEAKDVMNKYWGSIPYVVSYQNRNLKKAKKEGTIYNYFGLPRRVKFWLSSSDPKQRAFGQRTVGNTVIQSVGASLLKMAIIKLWKNLINNPKYKDDCRFISTIHDECNLAVSKERAEELIRVFYNCMRTEIPGFSVPFEVGLEVGNRWGACFEFYWGEDGHLYPAWEKVPEVEQPQEEVEETQEVFVEDGFVFDLDLDF